MTQENNQNSNVNQNPYSVNRPNIVGKSDRFQFQPVSAIFDTPNPDIINSQLTQEYINVIDYVAPSINKLYPPERSNYNNPAPNYPTGNYDFIQTAVPAQINTGNRSPGAGGSLTDLFGSYAGADQSLAAQVEAELPNSSPTYFSKEAVAFDRYYNHPNFDELGFNPYRDNEAYYNANSTMGDDLVRMLPQLGNQALSGFKSAYRSMGDIFQGQNYFTTPDLETANEFEDAMEIGMSSRGGVGGFSNNLALNLGYTGGIFLSIAAEEVALAAATAASGGAAAPAAVARTGVNVGRGAKALSALRNTFTMGRGFTATRNLYRTFKNSDKALDFYSTVKAGANFAGDFFAPETMKAIRSLKTTENGLGAATNLAKLSTTGGGFYRDMRALNFTLSESKLEGGLVYNEQLNNAIDVISEKKDGAPLTEEDMRKAHLNALEAAHKTALFNAPVIYLSNKIVLNKALGARFTPFGREVFQEGLGKMRKKLLTESTIDAAGKVVKTPFKKGTRSLFSVPSLKGLGKGATYRKGAYNALKFMSANLAEGLQETYQEAVASGVQDYYTSLMQNPTASQTDLLNTSVKSGIQSQMTGEGLEVFLSGFLTGGLMGPVQNFMFSTIPNGIRKVSDPEGYKQMQEQQDLFLKQLIDDGNAAWNQILTDPAKAFNMDVMNLSAQQQANKATVAAQYNNSKLNYFDNQAFADFHHFHRLIEKGGAGQFREMLRDLNGLSDKNFADAFEITLDEVEGRRAGIQQAISNLETMQKNYDNFGNKFTNPFNPSAFDQDTPEYVDEALGSIAYNNYRMLYMYSRNEFNDAVKRTDDILSKLRSEGAINITKESTAKERSEKGIVGYSFSDLTTLLDPNSIAAEIKLLGDEINTLTAEDADQDTKVLADNKQLAKDRLQEYFDVITDPKRQNEDGIFDSSKTSNVKALKKTLLNYLGDNVINNEFLSAENIDDVVAMMADYATLENRAVVYNQAIETLLNPDSFNTLLARMRSSVKDVFNNKKEILRENLESTFTNKKINEALTALMEVGVVVDPEDSKEFIRTGDASVIKNLYTEQGLLTATSNPEAFTAAIQILTNFQQMMAAEQAARAERAEAAAKEAAADIAVEVDTSNILEEAGIKPIRLLKIEDASTGQLKYIVDLLESKYREHKANNPGNAVKTKSAWISREGKQFIDAYYDLKQIWATSLSESEKAKLNTDEGFAKWLLENRVDPVVTDVLRSHGLNFAQFYIKPTAARGLAANVVVSVPGVGYLQKGAVEDTYRILDKYYQPLSDEILNELGIDPLYDDITEAKIAFDKYKSSVISTDTFTFGGVTLSNGTTLTHKDTGQKFTVNVPNIGDVQTGSNLTIIPEDSVTDEGTFETLAVSEGQMNDFAITIEEVLGVPTSTANMSKLSITEPIRVIPNLIGLGIGDTKFARERLAKILNVLTQEELDGIELEVTDINNAGAVRGDLKKPGEDANPNIRLKRTKYSIAIKVSASAIEKIQNLFEAESVKAIYETGIIGYVINENVDLLDANGKPIDPTAMSQEQFQAYFDAEPGQLEEARNNFGIQKALMTEINSRKEVDTDPVTTIKLSDIGFDFILTAGRFSYLPGNKTVPFQTLDFQTTSGDYLMIVDNTFKRVIPSSALPNATEVNEKVQSALAAQGLYDPNTDTYMFKGKPLTSRYVAIIKSDNAPTYTLAPLQTAPFSEEQLTDLFTKLYDRSQQTLKENGSADQPLDKSIKKSQVKDKAYNSTFDTELKKLFYITATAGTQVTLAVVNNGAIKISAFNQDKGINENIYIEPAEMQQDPDNPMAILDLITEKFAALPNVKEIFGEKFSSMMFSNTISLEATVEQMVDKLVTTLDPSVRIGRTMFLNTTSDKVQAAKDVSTIVASAQKPSVTLEDVAKNSQAAEDASEIQKQAEEAPAAPVEAAPITQPATQQAAPTQEITEHKPIDTTGRDVLYLKPLTSEGKFSEGESNLSERRHVAKIILDKDNPSKGTVEFLPSAETLLVSQYHDYLNLNLANYHPKSDFAEDGRLVTLKPARVEKEGTGWKIIEKAEVELTDESKVSKVVGQQAAPVTEEVTPQGLTNEQSQQVLLNDLNDIESQIKERKRSIGNGKTPAEKRRLFESDPLLIELNNKKDSLNNRLDALGYKIVPEGFSQEDSETLSEFSEWLKENLPDFISVESIDIFEDNLRKNGITAGAFNISLSRIGDGVEVAGKIYASDASPFKYHEAFHAVYRMLLTEEQRKKLSRVAKRELLAKLKAEGKTLKVELQKFKNSAELYSRMSPERLEQEYVEEYMADEFQKFKKNPRSTKTDTEIKSFFTRIIEWIKSIFSNFTKNELKDLFEKIDSGKFKDASIQNNRVIESLQDGITVDAYKLIRSYKNEYLDSAVSRGLVQSIAATYIFREARQTTNYNPSELLDSVLDDFAFLYSSENNEDLPEALHEDLFAIEDAFTDYSKDIKDAAESYLSLLNIQAENQEVKLEEIEDELGGRTTAQWDLSAEMVGGFSSLPKFLRSYIATTTLQEKDLFGNSYLVQPSTDTNGNSIEGTGERLIVAVDFANVYNGALKAVANTSNQVYQLQKLVTFAETNDQTNAFVTRFLNDIGVSREDVMNGELTKVKDSYLFNAVTKGFKNYKRNYLIEIYDAESGTIVYESASNRDDVANQRDVWSQAYVSRIKEATLNPVTRRKVKTTLSDLQTLLSAVTEKISDENLNAESLRLSKDISQYIGFQLSAGYIKYSIIENLVEKTDAQSSFALQYPDAAGLILKDIVLMQRFINDDIDGTSNALKEARTPLDEAEVTKNVVVDQNLFSIQTGMGRKILTMAINNALFDEAVGASVIKNAENKNIYVHQQRTANLQSLYELNTPDYLNKLVEDNPYLKRNLLYSNDQVQAIIDKRGIIVYTVSGNVIESDRKKYGKYSPEDIEAMLYSLYTANVNKQGTISNKLEYKNEKGETEVTAVSPVFIRVLGESNMNDTIPLPIIKTIDTNTGQINEETVGLFRDFIISELERIMSATVDIKSEGGPTTLIIGYNATTSGDVIAPDENGNAFKFHNNKSILSQDIRETIENKVKELTREDLMGMSYEDVLSAAGVSIKNINDSIIQSLDQLAEDAYDKLSSPGLLRIGNDIKEGFKNLDATQKAKDELRSVYNLGSNEQNNLKQVFLSNFLNAKSVNELLLGDQAELSLKDGTAQVKRARGANGAIVSADSVIGDASKGVPNGVKGFNIFGVTEPAIESAFSGTNIERADAQSYGTVMAARHLDFGIGQLPNGKALLYDRLETGESIESSEIFGDKTGRTNGYVSQKSMLNSRKILGYDNRTYLKTSLFILTPELTSEDNGFRDTEGNITIDSWDPKPNMEELHNLRIKMERAELETGTPSILAPLTALKMLKKNVTGVNKALQSGGTLTQDDAMYMDAQYFGIQMVNPSNKTTITDPSQIKTLITSEQDPNVEVNIAGVSMKMGDVIKKYHEALSNRINLSSRSLRNLVLVPETVEEAEAEFIISAAAEGLTTSLYTYLKYAQDALASSKSKSMLLEYFAMDGTEPKYNLNNPIVYNEFRDKFLSFWKQSMREKVKGQASALVSDLGMKVYRRVLSVDENGIPDRFEIIRGVDFEKSTPIYRQGEADPLIGLDEAIKNANGQGVVILDRLRMNVKEYDADGNSTGITYSEVLAPPHFKDVMDNVASKGGAIPDAVAKRFGVRIPSQDKHSAINAKIVDFLPAIYGSVTVAPAELVEVAGSDFDIDKLYLQMKEFFFNEKGELREYGKAATEEGKYVHYARYVSNEVTNKQSFYFKALDAYKNNALEIINPLDNTQQKRAEDKGMSVNAIKALGVLGLPVTFEDYIAYKRKVGSEPYSAPMTNESVDYKFALLGNSAMTQAEANEVPIAYQPADLKPLTNKIEDAEAQGVEGVLEFFKREVPELFESVNEEDVDADTLTGQILAFNNIQAGADSIGVVVKPNLGVSLLRELGASLGSVKIGEAIYGDVDTKTELDIETGQPINGGFRTQYILSALITAMTDNAKERLAGRLGLSKDYLPLLVTMTAMGIPVKTSILMLNTPQFTNKEGITSEQTFIRPRRLSETDDVSYSLNPPVSITNEGLVDLINLKTSTPENEQRLGLMAEAVLSVLDDINVMSQTITNVSTLASLNQGFSDFNSVESAIKFFFDEKTNKFNPIFDQLMSDTYIGSLVRSYQTAEQIANELFITRAEGFKNFAADKFNAKRGALEKYEADKLSFLTIQAYMHKLATSEKPGTIQKGATLSNQLLYPQLEGNETIVDIVSNLREQYKDKYNFFLQKYLVLNQAAANTNRSGLDLIDANTFNKLNDSQKVDLQTGFMQIYNDRDTRSDAITILNYIMVKSGLQFEYKSILDAVAPSLLDEYFESIDEVHDILKNNQLDKFEDVFGMNYNALERYFVDNYFMSQSSLDLHRTTSPEFFEIYKQEASEGKSVPEYIITFLDRSKVLMKLEDGQYTVVNQASMKGSIDQNPIGFMFDGAQDRPTKKELNQYQNSKGQAPSDNTLVQDTVLGDRGAIFAPENVDFDGSTNDEVKVDGVDAAEAPLVSLEDIIKAKAPDTQPVQEPTEEVSEGLEVGQQTEFTFELEDIGVSTEFLDQLGTTTNDQTLILWEQINTPDNKELLKKAEVTTYSQFQAILETNNLKSQEEFLEYLRKCNR